MNSVSIAVVTNDRQTRRQVARALRSGGMAVSFLDSAEDIQAAVASNQHNLMILDCDSGTPKAVDAALVALSSSPRPMPVVLLSLRPDKGPMVQLLEGYDVSHLVAKHGAIRVSKDSGARPVYAMLDERELLVTCDKVLSKDIFGIDKYIGSWGVVFQKRTIRSMKEKAPFLDEFERYLRELECPSVVIPDIVTVAEEFLINAIVHAPRRADGTPKYEDEGLKPDLVLEPNEYVEVVYGCDGQRLMVSVSDNFGGLHKKTLYEYLKRGFSTGIEPEQKPSGAGLGLSLSMRSIHQLIFNVKDGVRTEAIAGWYLRVQSAQEFRQVGKSLNLFWLNAGAQPDDRPKGNEAFRFVGRIDETFDFSRAEGSTAIDMRDVTTITSRGLIRWIEFVRSLKGRNVELIALPESILFQATAVSGVIDGLVVRTVVVPFECPACGFEERREMRPGDVLSAPGGSCPECKSEMRFGGLPSEYQSFLGTLDRHPG